MTNSENHAAYRLNTTFIPHPTSSVSRPSVTTATQERHRRISIVLFRRVDPGKTSVAADLSSISGECCRSRALFDYRTSISSPEFALEHVFHVSLTHGEPTMRSLGIVSGLRAALRAKAV
jgi:hypothetical protein